jgi:WD40 repeat protein
MIRRMMHPAATLLVILVLHASASAQELTVVSETKIRHGDSAVAGLRQAMFTADGKTLVTAGYSAIRVWDVTGEPKERAALKSIADLGNHGLWDVVISPDGKLIAAGGAKILYLYEVADGGLKERAVLRDQSGAVRALAFSPDSRLLASGSDDKTIYLYDVSGDKPAQRASFKPDKAGSAMVSVAFGSDGKTLLFAYQGGAGNVGFADVSGKQPKITAAVTENPLRRAAVSPDGKQLAVFLGNFDIQLYDVDGAKIQKGKSLKGHTKQGRGLAFSPDGKLLASSAIDGKYLVWDVAGGTQLLSRQISGDIENVAFSPAKAGPGEYRLAVTTHQREAILLSLKIK